ncbi:MAG: Fic family protein [Prevotella sp.]|nr:Fic family protein [Prevotella sp.]
MTELQSKYNQADENNRRLSAYRPLPPETLKSLREYYRVGLTYTSNALEGNSLTESETKVVIEDGLTIEGKPLRDHYEAVGHAKAYDYIYNITEKEKLSEEDILSLHRLFYQQIDAERAGHYRTVKVYISGSHYAVAAVSKIPAEMQKLVKWYNENEKKLHPVELAATLHQRFVFIHPFVDGNGRVARLLMNLALLRNGYTIAIIPAILRHEYIYSLETAHTRPEVFADFIADRVIATQLDLLRLMKDENDTVNDIVNDTVNDAGSAQLTKTEQTVLEAISTHPNYSYEQLAAACGVSRPTIARTIKALQGYNCIRRIGSDKKGHWEVRV